MPEFHEIVHATLREGLEEQMLARRAELEAAVREKLPGLLDIHLVKLDDGSWLDVLRWESREAADAAIPKFAEVPEAGEIHGYFDRDLGHFRGEQPVVA